MPDLLHRLETVLAGRYAIERELGRGGTATVFLARDLRHRRLIALKVLRPEVAAVIGSERFLREIEIAAGLTHPHILPIHDSGEAGGLLYFVMPYVSGESLRARLVREGQLPVEDALRITRDVGAALSYAHAQGFVHRDIKPENILIEHGEAVVADFGLARALEAAADSRITGAGFAMGTPAYMSPEQAAGPDVDARADLYSVGCVLYEMLTGEPPFTGPTAQVILARHRADFPRPVRVTRSAVAPELEQVVLRLLAKIPADRYATTDAAMAALPTTSSQTIPISARRRMGPRTLALAVAGLALAALVTWRVWPSGQVERSAILMADFDGPPDDPTLVDALEGLVSAELNQSKVLATMPRPAIRDALHAAGLAETTHVSLDIGRNLAIRNAVRTVLGGSIRRLGDGRYSMLLTVLDAETGSDVVTATAAAADSDLIARTQALAREVRRGLGERRRDIEANKPLWQVTTPSLAAYRKYASGIRLSVASQLANSNQLLREAIALDTGFAAAWGALGMNYINMRVLDSAADALREALRRPGRLSDAERYRLTGDAAYALDGDLPAAISAYSLYLDAVGHSMGGRNNRGLFLTALGRYEDALDDFRQAAADNRFGGQLSQIPLLNEAATLVVLGRTGEARTVARQLTGPGAAYIALMISAVDGRWAEADSLAGRAAADPEAPPWLRMQAIAVKASALAAAGDPASADASLRLAASGHAGSESRWYEHARLLLALAAGSAPPPLSDRASRDTLPGGILLRGLWAAARGDAAAAGPRLDSLGRLPDIDRRRLRGGPEFLRALLALRSGRPGEAIGLIGPSAVAGENDGTNLDRIGSFDLRLVAADAYAAAGRVDSAAAMGTLALSSVRMPPGMIALRGLPCSLAAPRVNDWRRRAALPPLQATGCEALHSSQGRAQ
jgi:serine/threonine-protein kinase